MGCSCIKERICSPPKEMSKNTIGFGSVEAIVTIKERRWGIYQKGARYRYFKTTTRSAFRTHDDSGRDVVVWTTRPIEALWGIYALAIGSS